MDHAQRRPQAYVARRFFGGHHGHHEGRNLRDEGSAWVPWEFLWKVAQLWNLAMTGVKLFKLDLDSELLLLEFD